MPEPVTPEQRLQIASDLWDWTPHPGQRELLCLRDATGAEPRVLVAVCGRRWGKTEAMATDTAIRLLTEPDLGQMVVAPTCDQARLFFDAVADKIADAQAGDAAAAFPVLSVLQIKQTPYPQIRRKTDGVALFSARTAGRTGRSLRGFGTTRKLRRFRVIVDERAFVPDEAIERAIKPMLATSPGGGQLVMISSPNGRRGGFYNDFLKGEQGGGGRYRAVRLPSSQNPMVDAAFLAEMQAEMSERAFRAEFLAEFTDGTGQVFPDAEIDAATCLDDYGTVPRFGATYVAGADFGRRGDYTVVCVLQVEGATLRLVGFARWRGIGYGLQAVRVAELLQSWNVSRCATDGTGVGDPVTDSLQTELMNRAVNCALEPIVFTSASKERLIDTLSLALSRQTVRFPPHPDLIAELRRYEFTTGDNGNTRFSAPSGVHDDAVCALALAVHAARDFVRYAGAGGAGEPLTRFVHRARREASGDVPSSG
ncbi:MAG: hypothetical protein H7Y38_17180 [Armatimonadetes bacterium]|nr:hypothetical protein [Armatimonadota bacterium]